MIFEDEEAQTEFHKLPTQVQYDFVTLEETLAQMGYPLHVELTGDGALEVLIRIDEKSQIRTLQS